jgi:ABC-type sulfate transport system substrate-binding protein
VAVVQTPTRNLVDRRTENKDWRCLVSLGLGVGLLILVAFYGGRVICADADSPVRLVVYAFSTQEEVLTQIIFPAFEQIWESKTGCDLTIEGVFGPSGTLTGQINLGAPADVALLSNEQHVK